MDRREFLSIGARAGLIGVLPSATLAANMTASETPGVYYVPGYRSDLACYRGRPVLDSDEFRRHLPAGYDGETTLLTRIDEATGAVTRALLPIRGHAVSLHPAGGAAFWNSMDRSTQIAFDATSLEPVAIRHLGDEFVGGGHGVFTPDGSLLIATERKRYEFYRGDPAAHEGRLALRDPNNLRLIESYGSGGMSPHDLFLTEDGAHLVVAHYGSLLAPDDWRPDILAPGIAIVELASGRTVEQVRLTPADLEVRHLAGNSRSSIMALLVARGSIEALQALMSEASDVYERPDSSSSDAGAYLPAPLLRVDAHRQTRLIGTDPLAMRQGQSILYDAREDEFLATFAGSDRIVAIDARTGGIKVEIDTAQYGLHRPRGIALHPDGVHYAVSGSWRDVLLFRRGAHDAPTRRLAITLFEHSHMTLGGSRAEPV